MGKLDRARVESARLLVVTKLEQYGYADAVIIAVLGVSKSTFHRLIEGRYLKRRPKKDVHPGDEFLAKELAVRVLVMDEFSVVEILAAMDISQAELRSRLRKIREELDMYTPEQRARMARLIGMYLLSDWEPLPVRDWKARKKLACWKRARKASY